VDLNAEAIQICQLSLWIKTAARGKQGKDELPPALRDYIQEGERLGPHDRPLIKARRPWYRMEERAVPAFLFTYLGRRDCRFIENQAGVVPLTGFLCVYPWDNTKEYREKLCRALNHPDTIANLPFVGKTYGGGAIKVEPRQLDSLEIPTKVLAEVGLGPVEIMAQPTLFETPAAEPQNKKRPPSINPPPAFTRCATNTQAPSNPPAPSPPKP
jgi:hypothetical protein